MMILIGLSRGEDFHMPLYAYLPFHLRPKEDQGDLGVLLYLPRLPALVIAIKKEAFMAVALEQYDAGGGHAVVPDSGEGHDVGFYYSAFRDFLEPSVELLEGVRIYLVYVKSQAVVVLSEMSDFVVFDGHRWLD
jgi:hypothetical protein